MKRKYAFPVIVLTSLFCLTSCFGNEENELDRARNIRFSSSDDRLHFTLEHDQLNPSEDTYKFFVGRGEVTTGEESVPFFVEINILPSHYLFIMPLQSATETLYTPGDNHFEDFQTWMKIGVRRDILGLFVSDTSKIDAYTEYNYSGISYFDDFEQTLTWEPIEEKDRNPLNYFARTWQNEEFGLFFNQDNPKLFIEKKIHGTLEDGSEVIMRFANNRFTLSRYEDKIEQDVLLDGIYETGLSSIMLYIETNNLLEETPDCITLL